MRAIIIQSDSNIPTVSTKRLRTGQVLSTLAVLFLTFDGVIKMLHITPVVETFARMGWPDHLAFGIGALELALLAIYLIPATAPLGALLWTGFLGGAIASHLRLGDPFFSHTIFPVYVAGLLWAGLYLRDERLRSLAPWR
jgi:hypothetical protein